MSIEMKMLTKRFGSVEALSNVSLTLENNRIYGLLGNNGAGKSTLMNIITGRLYPDSGEVKVDGCEILKDEALGKLFLTGEDNLFPDDMRVMRALETAALFYPRFDMQYARSAAERFGLETKKKIKALSTGYASIFRLILGLSVNTPYLLFDEPVLGLDAGHRDLFYQLLLQKYTETPSCIVVSTHLIAEVQNIVEHTVIIKDGRIVKNEPTETLLAGAYNICGPVSAMDAYLSDKCVLTRTGIGGLSTACVEGSPADVPDSLEVSRVQLQDYFISLMNKEGAK